MALMPELPPMSGSGPLLASKHTRSQNTRLEAMTEEELLDLRSQVDALLPIRRLKDVSMEVELVRQLGVVHRLQAEVIDDENTPANQRAQVAGQVANVLAVLSKLQVELYSSERLKKIEAVLIETINMMSPEAQEFFFQEYEGRLGLER